MTPSQKFCTRMKTSAVSRLAAEQRRLHEGVADEAAQRLDLVLDHGGDFGRLDALELTLGGKRSTRSTSSKRRRRSMRSPSRPL